MSITPVDPHEEIVVPGVGELVNLNDYQSCATALDGIRDLESKLREIKGLLSSAIQAEATRQGVKTLELADGRKAVLSGGTEYEYDADLLAAELAVAGMPQERIAEIVVPTVTYRVSAVKAKQAAAANPVYADVIEACRREVVTPVRVSLRRT